MTDKIFWLKAGKRNIMKKRLAVLMACILVVSAFFASCGKKNDQNATTKANSGAASENEIQQGGEIVVGVTNDIDNLDPHKYTAAGTGEILFNMFDGLVKVTPDGDLVPAIAESYTVNEDGTVYTFVIRQGVKFHNGTELNADDVVYSVKRVSGLDGSPDASVKHESALSTLTSVEKGTAEDGKETVTLTLSAPNTELLGYLTFAIIPDDYTKQSETPVGAGPFKFVSYTEASSVVMEKFADYYGTPAYLDKVTFKITSDTDAAFTQLLAGTIDVFPYLTADQADQLTENYNIEVGNMNLVQALFLNNTVKPLDDIRVRQAICYAIDRQGVLDMVAAGKGTVIGTGMFAGFEKYYNADTVNTYATDLAKAKQLLSDAGYPDGFDITITVPSNYQFHVDTAQVLVEQLKEVGINATISLVEWATWLDEVYKGRNFETTIIGLDADLAPSDVLKRYASTASGNFINYNNSEYDTLFASAVAETDDNKKVEDYKKLQEILTNDAASAYIQDPSLIVAVSKKLSGYTFYPVYVQDMSRVYFVKQ